MAIVYHKAIQPKRTRLTKSRLIFVSAFFRARGCIIIEQVFNIPGMGRLLMTSINGRDLPVVQTIIMIIALVVITVNYIADISYKYIDPRIRFR